MPSIDDVYRKFGETSEAAQLLETELGNILFLAGSIEQNLIEQKNEIIVTALYSKINRQTLGQLIKDLKSSESIEHLEDLLNKALKERNRLMHSFYRRHNFRRNSEDGRTKMIEDLEHIHRVLLEAYKSTIMLLSGIDLDKVIIDQHPIEQVSI